MKRHTYKFLIVAAVFLAFFVTRLHSFYLTHDNIDEFIYLSLATKLDKFGLKAFSGEYNLNNLGLEIENNFCKVSQEAKGYLLIPGLHNEILSHQPPLLSSLLAFSHRIFIPDRNYILLYENRGRGDFALQFYACLIPFLFSFLLVLSVYVLGSMLFSRGVGLFACLLMIFSPIDMLTSQKIWADDLVSFLLAFTVILYLLAIKRNNVLLSSIAGICAALSFLAKQSGLLSVAVIIVIHFILVKTKERSYYKIAYDKKIISFIAFFAIGALPWLIVFLVNYGLRNFIFQYYTLFSRPGIFSTPFLELVNNRPWYTYILTLSYQQPVFLLVYASIFYVFHDKDKRKNLLFLFIWFVIFLGLATFMRDKEERYLLPAYPAICILSSYLLSRLSLDFSRDDRLISKLNRAMLVFLIALSFTIAVKIGLTYVFSRSCIIPVPL